MNTLGTCAVLWFLVIYIANVCNAECDEYIIVFEETTCPIYRLKPQKQEYISWDNVSFPCNSTDIHSENKLCVVEFDCLGTDFSCQDHIKVINRQTHLTIADNNTVNLNKSRIEAHKEYLTNDVSKSNVTAKEKQRCIMHEEYRTMYHINLIYINENLKQNQDVNKTDQVFHCDYAETVCFNEGEHKNCSFSDIINGTEHTHYNEIQILINRDETSPVQPIFTGYFSESSNDSPANYNDNFKAFQTVTILCPILKVQNCTETTEKKSYRQINVYIKTNYIENNTITKYPNCTKTSLTTETELEVQCEDMLFAKHNQHILQTQPKIDQLIRICQITDFNYKLSSEEQYSENNKIYFVSCSNETYKTPNFDSKHIPIYDIVTKNLTKINTTEKFIEKEKQTKLGNIITILITEKANNCNQNLSLNINEGKIIDLGIKNKKEKIIQNNNVELLLTSCIKLKSHIINETKPHLNIELVVILKNESLNTSDLKQFNGTVKEQSTKQRILLGCNYHNSDSSSNTTITKTTLQCEPIDLDLYNITGTEITSISQTSNNKTSNRSNNKTKQEQAWICQLLELNNTYVKQQKSKLYFKHCHYGNINNSKNEIENNKITPISVDKNIKIDKINTNDSIETKEMDVPSGELEVNKDEFLPTNQENFIKILVTEEAENCSNNLSLNINEGKIIDLGMKNNKEKIIQNNNVELILSSCIKVKPSINETQLNPKKELVIILKNESLNTSDLKQFNGTLTEECEKQKLLLRCDQPNRDSTSNTTILQCDLINLDSYNITGIEIHTNVIQTSNTKNTNEQNTENVKPVDKINKQTKINKNSNSSSNKTVEKNVNTLNNNENNSKVQEKKEIQKNSSDSKGKWINNFNRKKDIPNGEGPSMLNLGSSEADKILLIAILTIAGVGILVVFASRAFRKKTEYNPTPTREPPDEEETPF